MPKTESQIMHDIILALGCEPDLDIERRTVGKTTQYDPVSGKEYHIKYGTVGEADLQATLGPNGRLFALEIKTPTGRLSKEQKMWISRKRALGAFVAVVRSVEEARAALARARTGATE